jgi:hypothetical protein
MEFRREPASEVIQEALSRRASTSSVANDGRGRSSTSFKGGHGFTRSSRASRLCLILSTVMCREISKMLLRTARVDEYAIRPMNKLGT